MQNKQILSYIKTSFPLLSWHDVAENFRRGTLWWSCSGVSNNSGLRVELYTKRKEDVFELRLILRASILVLVTVTVKATVEELELQLAQLIENFNHKTKEYLSIVGQEVEPVNLAERE